MGTWFWWYRRRGGKRNRHTLDISIVEPKEDFKQENIILKKQLDQAKEEIEQLKKR